MTILIQIWTQIRTSSLSVIGVTVGRWISNRKYSEADIFYCDVHAKSQNGGEESENDEDIEVAVYEIDDNMDNNDDSNDDKNDDD